MVMPVDMSTLYVNEKGGKKTNIGKVPLGLLFDAPYALEAIARIMEFGANKYERGNWKLVNVEQFKDALLRHINEISKGNDWDNGPEGTGQLHWANVACNAIFILQIELQKSRPSLPEKGE